jgi:hypothetical protein
MTDLLLLGCGAERTHELASLFKDAGYAVIEVNDLVSCCRHLLDKPEPSDFISLPRIDAARGITILDAEAIGASAGVRKHSPQLLNCIMSLARQLAPGWRLSMRHRRLETPNSTAVALTTLEFNFIKHFALVDVGEAVSRKQIVQAFGEDYLSYDQNRLDTLVRRLRQKVEARVGIKLPLNTERVRGFSFGDVLIIDP